MPLSRSLLRTAAAATLSLCAATTHAALTAYTSSASFAAAVTAPATDTFAGLPIDFLASPATRTTGPYSYTTRAPGGLYGVGPAADPWLSTNLPGRAMTFGGFTGGVQAFGGMLFGSDIAGAFQSGQTLTFTATDSLGATLVQSLSDATRTSFVGFVSTASILSVAVDIDSRDAYVTADTLMLGQRQSVQAIPEPETYAMLLGGLGLMGALARRRRSRAP